MTPVSADAVVQAWEASLSVFLVVLLAVAALLALILREARKIKDGVAQIWNVGQKIANNTIHIALLDTTNHIAGRILASAVGVVAATAALQAHAADCPGCPACVLERR